MEDGLIKGGGNRNKGLQFKEGGGSLVFFGGLNLGICIVEGVILGIQRGWDRLG